MDNKYFIITYTSPKDDIFHNITFSGQDFISASKMWFEYAGKARLTTINIMEAKNDGQRTMPLCVPYNVFS